MQDVVTLFGIPFLVFLFLLLIGLCQPKGSGRVQYSDRIPRSKNIVSGEGPRITQKEGKWVDENGTVYRKYSYVWNGTEFVKREE